MPGNLLANQRLRRICSHDVAVRLQNRRPSRVDVCHQLLAIRVSLIGMIALGELKIGQVKLPSGQRRYVNAKPFIEGQRIRQCILALPFQTSLAVEALDSK